MRLPFAIAFIGLLSAPAAAAEPGMFLCRSPVFAEAFWNDIVTVRDKGVEVNREIAESVAKKNECRFVASDRLRPVQFVAGMFQMTDGTVFGFAAPQLLIMYANRPSALK